MTTSSFSCINANDLPEVQMNAGDEQDWTYNVYDSVLSGSSLVDLNAATFNLKLFRYGDYTTTILTLPGVISGSPLGTVTVNFPSASSIGLAGVYQQKPVIIDYQGKTHIPSQGKVVIFGSPQS
jgi:hypothetical protein